jgi:hypothetical protein
VDSVWSASFVVEGGAVLETRAVGPNCRAEGLPATARAFRHPRSGPERANDRPAAVVLGLVHAVGADNAVLACDLSSYAVSAPSRNLPWLRWLTPG